MGGAGDDDLEGGGGKDVLKGGKGNDDLAGGGGKDRLVGAKGKDVMDGGGGKDVLKGGAGNDDMDGGRGADRLIGGRGRDEMTGGQGGDTFVFAKKDGFDTVTDFDTRRDVLDLGRVADGLGDLEFKRADGGDSLLVKHDGGRVLLEDVSFSERSSASDWIEF